MLNLGFNLICAGECHFVWTKGTMFVLDLRHQQHLMISTLQTFLLTKLQKNKNLGSDSVLSPWCGAVGFPGAVHEALFLLFAKPKGVFFCCPRYTTYAWQFLKMGCPACFTDTLKAQVLKFLVFCSDSGTHGHSVPYRYVFLCLLPSYWDKQSWFPTIWLEQEPSLGGLY